MKLQNFINIILQLFLLGTLIETVTAAHNLVASPTTIDIGLTRSIQIECSSTRDSTIAVDSSIRIVFSNSLVQPVYRQLGKVDSVFGIDNSSGAVDSGEIVGNGTSKLRLKWNYPKQDRAGVYRCEVREKNVQGLPKIKSLTLNVDAVVPDQVTVLEFIQTISSDLEEVKGSLAEEKLKLAQFIGRLENGKSKFFHVSNLFQRRRYYLSSDSNILVAGNAEAICELFGGYLVEIDSAEEYQFIVAFLSNFSQYQMVLTGGSDEAMENNWINAYSQTPVKYINWIPGEPNGGRDENCIYFQSYGGWLMNDYKCNKGISEQILGYMCEIPE